MYLNEGDKNLQEVYDALLEDCDKYAKVPKSVVEDAKCEVEKLKEELLNAYSKIKFLKLEVIQENVKVECITIKKLDNVLSSQRPSTDKTDLGYTDEGSSSGKPKKEMKFLLAKNVDKPMVEKPKVEIPTVEKKDIGPKPKAKGKLLPKNQRRP